MLLLHLRGVTLRRLHDVFQDAIIHDAEQGRADAHEVAGAGDPVGDGGIERRLHVRTLKVEAGDGFAGLGGLHLGARLLGFGHGLIQFALRGDLALAQLLKPPELLLGVPERGLRAGDVRSGLQGEGEVSGGVDLRDELAVGQPVAKLGKRALGLSFHLGTHSGLVLGEKRPHHWQRPVHRHGGYSCDGDGHRDISGALYFFGRGLATAGGQQGQAERGGEEPFAGFILRHKSCRKS